MATNCVEQSLKDLGFEKAAKKVEDSKELVRKTHIAYQNFEFITPEDVQKYREDLKSKTLRDEKGQRHYMDLKFYSVKDYEEVPPADVLEKLRAAKDLNCFDSFEIAKLESVVEVPDPILFGKIDGCGDLFMIAQWDNDVTLEAIKEASKK